MLRTYVHFPPIGEGRNLSMFGSRVVFGQLEDMCANQFAYQKENSAHDMLALLAASWLLAQNKNHKVAAYARTFQALWTKRVPRSSSQS